jgi:PAS domain S-box-containing protein
MKAIALPKSLRPTLTGIPLRAALTVPFLLLTVGATALVGYLSDRNGQEAVSALSQQLMVETNSRVTQKLQPYLQTPLLINRLNADAVQYGQLDVQNSTEMESALLVRMQQFPAASAVLFASPEGMLRAIARRPEGYWGVANASNAGPVQIYRLNQDGNWLERTAMAAPPEGNLANWRDRPWYQRAISTGEAGWNPIAQCDLLDTLTLSTSHPVYDPATGRLMGVFAVHVQLNSVSEFLHDLDISRSGRVLIVAPDGTLVATSTHDPLHHQESKSSPRFPRVIEESSDALTRSLGQYLHDLQLLEQEGWGAGIALEASQSLTFDYEGTPHFVKITPIQDEYGLEWYLVMAIPQDHLLGTLRAHRRVTILLCLLTIGGAIALGLWAAAKLAARLVQLNQVSGKLASGRLDQRLPTDSLVYELNGLARAFNQMADQLQRSFDRIRVALEESEEKFTTVFRTSPDPMAIATLAEGRLLDVNDSLLAFFGYDRTEVIGRTALELNFWHSLEDRNYYRAMLQEQGRIRNQEVRLQTKSGEVRTALLSAEIQTLEGEPCLIVMHRDISDRKQVEERLYQSQQWLEQYSQVSPSMIYTLVEEPDGQIWFEYLSSAVEGIGEVTVEEVLKDASVVMDLIHPEDRAEYRAVEAKCDQTLCSFSHQFRIVTPSGLVNWVHAQSQPEQRENGAIAWHGVVVDINNYKQAEEALRQSEAQKRAIFNAIPDLIIHMHRDGTYLDIKPTTAFPMQLPNLSVGENAYNILPPEEAARRLAATTTALETGEVQVYEFPLWVEGQHLWQEARIIPINPDEVLVIVRDLTQRHQIEEALRQSQARLAMAQQVAQVGYWELDLASQVHTWSDLTFRQFGLNPAQPEPSVPELLQMVHPDDRPLFEQTRQITIETGLPYALDLRIVRPDGEIRYLDSRGEPILNAQGEVIKLMGTSVDITARKQAEATLRTSEERLRQIADHINQLFFVRCARSGEYLYISPGYEKIWGRSCASLYANPQSWLETIYPEDRAVVLQSLQKQSSASVVQREYRIIRPDGSLRWISAEIFLVKDEAEQPLQYIGFAEDTTDRKQLELSLRASEELFRRAFHDAPYGISLVAPTGQFIKVNAYYCTLLGYTEAELVSLKFHDITHPEDLETDIEVFQQVIADQKPSFQMQKRYISKQGTVIPVLMSCAPIRDPNGQLLYLVGHVQDIRDRLAVERMKKDFISVVSHELRTPLTSIRGALGLLGSGALNHKPEKANHMLNVAINNSDRLVRLVNDILSLERLESGKVPFVLEPYLVADLMQQAVDSVQAIADQAEITLDVTPLSVTLSLSADAIIQALTNLLSNAIKFSAPGSTVWLNAEIVPKNLTQNIHGNLQDDASYPQVLFTVKDQGRGIPEEKLDLIFEQFQQVDVSDSRKKGGTGLGLAICKKIVHQHGGRIWVESRLGKGSSFYFTLPLPAPESADHSSS